ncbi:FIG00761799: membrane protein [hydrothermal vent metagenome]|uniref:FIG00761799: membrane protein n=1 Tax=hydrothermal vent metagenome TaxID=652676 RepID=A0A1W1BIU3_9ZZZZ
MLFLQTSHVSISYEEASLLYGDFSVLSSLTSLSLNLFGQNDLALRLVMILFHFLSAILMYEISKRYIPLERNRLWLLLVFLLLPGVVSAAIIVNSAGMLIFGLLLFVYLSEKIPQRYLNVLLLLYALADVGFVYLFLGLAVYYSMNKQKYNLVYVLALYMLTSYLYGFEVTGSPSGHFLDTIGIYSAIFTPIIFIYLFYTLYKSYFTSKIDMLWYLSATVLILSLVLSFRQRIPLEHFAPYLIIALPLAAQSFISSYRVRLKVYRKRYKLAFVLSFIFLISNTLIVFFNKELYVFIPKPQHHFAYEMHVAKELSSILKKRGVFCLTTDEKMQKRLKFYGVTKCKDILLLEKNITSEKATNVTISYKNSVLYRADVTIINNI